MISEFVENARGLGFIGTGFSKPQRPPDFDRFFSWIASGKNADMTWLERNIELRKDPAGLLPGCRTIISLAFPYPSPKIFTADNFSVSRYCRPDMEDYHTRLKELCKGLTGIIKHYFPGSRSRICVDSAPILERSFAHMAGIGFIGKNNMLILPGYGSYLYLAEILTTAEITFKPVDPIESECGECTLCLDVCPAGALDGPFSLDASRCLSYLTIERKEPITEDNRIEMGSCFFGCDRCQEVCPHNSEKSAGETILPSTNEFLSMDEDEFIMRFGRSAFARPGLDKIQSNIRTVRNQVRRQPLFPGQMRPEVL